MSDKSYKHYQFLQEKKKRQKEKAQAEFDAMSKYLNSAIGAIAVKRKEFDDYD